VASSGGGHNGGDGGPVCDGCAPGRKARHMGDSERLRTLHDAYVWEVNAAVGEGRLDLVSRLADEYLDEALRLMTSGRTACGMPDCAACQRPRPVPVVPRRRRWHRRPVQGRRSS
jgi:hypothetical protein